MGLPRQEYWGGLPFPSLADLPSPGIERSSPVLAGGFFTTEPPVKHTILYISNIPIELIPKTPRLNGVCICCTSVVSVYYLLWEKCDLESRETCGKQHV